MRIIPGSDNGQSSISSWRTANKTNLVNGDVWIMGHNTYGVDGGNFAFGTLAGSVYTINKDSRIINVNTNVHVQGNSVVTSPTLNSYLTTATASSTYQPISNMATYVTSEQASLLYQPRFNIAARFSFNSSNVVTLFFNFGIAPIAQ